MNGADSRNFGTPYGALGNPVKDFGNKDLFSLDIIKYASKRSSPLS